MIRLITHPKKLYVSLSWIFPDNYSQHLVGSFPMSVDVTGTAAQTNSRLLTLLSQVLLIEVRSSSWTRTISHSGALCSVPETRCIAKKIRSSILTSAVYSIKV